MKHTRITKEKLERQAVKMLERARNMDEEGRRIAVQSGFVDAKFWENLGSPSETR